MTNFNDKRTICTLLAGMRYPFITMDDVHLTKHAQASILTDLPTAVYGFSMKFRDDDITLSVSNGFRNHS